MPGLVAIVLACIDVDTGWSRSYLAGKGRKSGNSSLDNAFPESFSV